MSEQWRWVVGHEGDYEVSDQGRVRTYMRGSPRLLTLQRVSSGEYLAVDLKSRGTRRRVKVHILVLEAFVGPRPTGSVGCHNDGNPQNNALLNLRWDTQASNIADALRHGTWRNQNSDKTRCHRGHPLSVQPWAPEKRFCRECNLANVKAYQARKRAAR